MKSLRRMWRFVKPYQREAFWAMIFLLGVVAADISIPRLTQRVIDRGITARDMPAVLWTSVLMLGVSVLSALFSIGNTILAVRVGQHVEADLRSAVVRKVQSLSFGNLDHLQTGRLLVRATSDVTQVRMIVMMSLRILTRAPLWLLGSVVMLALNSPYLVPMMVVLMLGVLGLIWVFVGKARPGFEAVQKGRERLNEVLQENLAGVRVVKAFVRLAYENERFAEANEDLTVKNVQVMQLLSFLHPTMMLIINLGIVGSIWLGGGRVTGGEGSIGAIVASFNYLAFSLFPILMLAGMTGPLSAAEASAERIFEVLDSEPEVQDVTEPSVIGEVEGRVAFEDVCFSYDGEECRESVLEGVSFVAEPGQTIAILGATGSGKSSLIHLIPRFYDVKTGRVTLDDVDIRDLSLMDLRPQVGIAMQEAVLFSGTIRDNIRYGRPDATEDEVIEAAKAAQAHDFIMAFPQGYDTVLGQRGVNLSGGQKQRISIARALLVRPRILILDDSTSAVDFETEAKIEAALAELLRNQATRNTTIFVVAQRISTVLNADMIVVLDRGRIAAKGTHESLIETSRIYQEIYRSQLGDREHLLAA